MITDDERREVARRLRDRGERLIDMGELAEMLGFHRCSWSAGMLADRIADLIEPHEPYCIVNVRIEGEELERVVNKAVKEAIGIDRESLLELADEIDGYVLTPDMHGSIDARVGRMVPPSVAHGYAVRIREALVVGR
ncbi:MAG TPA: hypothetical protein K8U77_06185 [Slackia equolifaciens]|uniref:Uncharacterized protein n=1 Tax=Slackia equolifaciens TaxID=498718 RepID=A0A9D3A1I8_9ACTN|nr:hypothetical protein [Slackia equolifaciens]